jgi:hypothetical protein
MSDQINRLRTELDEVKRELAELRERFENHLKNPVFETAPQLRATTREKQMG